MIFFFKQKTAYEMRISDWSSDVCSSDLSDGEGSVWRTRRAAGARSELGGFAGTERRRTSDRLQHVGNGYDLEGRRHLGRHTRYPVPRYAVARHSRACAG